MIQRCSEVFSICFIPALPELPADLLAAPNQEIIFEVMPPLFFLCTPHPSMMQFPRDSNRM